MSAWLMELASMCSCHRVHGNLIRLERPRRVAQSKHRMKMGNGLHTSS